MQGKTSLVQILKGDLVAQPQPTAHPNCQELSFSKIRFMVFDLAGHKQARRTWSDYFHTVDAIVFLVDASNRKRIIESKNELDSILINEQAKNCAVLILGNKTDKIGALGEQDIIQIFSLNDKISNETRNTKKDVVGRPIKLFMCSILKQEGYKQAFEWLFQNI